MSRRTRKYTTAALAALAVGVMLAGCTGASDDGSDGDQIELEVWNPETDEAEIAIFEEMIDAYEADNPNVTVNLVTVPWADIFTKWQTAVQAGDPPDATVGSAAFAASFQGQGVLQPLNDVVEEIGGEDAWAESASSIAELSKDPDGNYFALPYVNNAVILWYNKAMLTAEGLGPPTTWDELETAAAAMTHGDQYGILVPSSTSQVTTQSLYSLILSNGGDLVDPDSPDTVTFDDPKSVEALEFYADLAQYSPPGSGAYDRPEAQAAMTTGRLGMFIYGSWMQSALVEAGPEVAANFGAVPVPANDGEGGSFMGNLSLFSFKDSEHPEEAKDFLSYMYQPDLYEKFVLLNPSAFIPVLASVQESPTYLDNEVVASQEELLAAVTAGLPYAKVFGLPNQHAGEWEGLNLIAQAATAVIEQGVDPQEAATTVADEMRDTIE